MTEPTLTEQLAALEADLEDSRDRHGAALHRKRTARSEAGREVIAPLIDFTDAILNRRPDAVPEPERADRKRELIREFFDAIEERGLTLDPVRSSEGYALAVADPSIDAEATAALAAKNTAQQAIRDFYREHGQALQDEQKKAAADAIRDALAGDDPDAIRDALNGPPADALTTADLAPPPNRVARPG